MRSGETLSLNIQLFVSYALHNLRNPMCAIIHSRFQLRRLEYVDFPNLYLRLRKCLFLVLLYMMGHVTAMSIQLDPTPPSPNIF